MTKLDFAGRIALVTGGSRGLGEALSRELARRGAYVVVGSRNVDACAKVVTTIRDAGGRAEAIELDVADCDAAVARVRDVDHRLGGLDLVVANAGVGPAEGGPTYAWESVRDACHVNFCGAIATLTAVLPAMVARRRGHVVGIGSISARAALPGALAYSTPKAGLDMAIACLRLDLAGTGVAATYVELGFVRTAMVERSTVPMPLLLEPTEAARTIVDRLRHRPRRVVLPRAVAALAASLGALPEAVREAVAARVAERTGERRR